MKRWFSSLALVVGLILGGCGQGDGDAGELTDRTTYPEGPYGVKEGQTLKSDFSFLFPDGTPFSLDENVFKNEHNRVMLITTTASWCTACIEEQPKLKALHGEFAKRGLFIVAAMFEDAEFATATLEQVREWKSKHKLPYEMVLDEAFELQAYYNRQLTPMNMVVDVDDMKILKITTGFDEQVIRAVIEANLP